MVKSEEIINSHQKNICRIAWLLVNFYFYIVSDEKANISSNIIDEVW